MAFAFIRQESHPFLDPTFAATSDPHEAQRALDVLGPDYLRLSRLGLGLVSFLAVTIGATGWGALLDAIVFHRATPADVVVGAVLAAVSVAAAWLLVRLAATGSRTVRSTASWLAGPYHPGRRAPSARGWVQTRLLLFSPPVFARIAAAAAAALFGAFAVFAVFSSFDPPSPVTVVYALWSVTAVATAWCLFSGMVRLVNGRSAADGIRSTVRDSLGR